MTDHVQSTADAAIAAGITLSNKLTWVSGGIGVAVSFWDSLPAGVAISVAGVLLGLGLNTFFRKLADRRDQAYLERKERLDAEHRARLEEYRRIEHEAKMRIYTAGGDSDMAPL